MRMTMDEWDTCMLRAGVIEAEFTKRDAQLCFTWCRMRAIDEFSAKFQTISFSDFIEVLVVVPCIC